MKKKLYFDFQFTRTGTSKFCPCTFTNGFAVATSLIIRERYGQLLDALPAATLGTSPQIKERNEVCAWFNLATALTSPMERFVIDFVDRRCVQPLFSINPANDGVRDNPIYTKNFAVAVRLAYAHTSGLRGYTVGSGPVHAVNVALHTAAVRGPVDYRGTLYVQRQHSIEV
jgi:hypothetical protein